MLCAAALAGVVVLGILISSCLTQPAPSSAPATSLPTSPPPTPDAEATNLTASPPFTPEASIAAPTPTAPPTPSTAPTPARATTRPSFPIASLRPVPSPSLPGPPPLP
jgi:hypothetical protein